jgi:hypothetical protein
MSFLRKTCKVAAREGLEHEPSQVWNGLPIMSVIGSTGDSGKPERS